eukprot:1715564-Pleurochrysis_carterae.AAC.2
MPAFGERSRASWHKRFVQNSPPGFANIPTQIRRTSDLPCGTEERLMSSQLPLLSWLAISALSAADQPSRSSRRACLRVLGSAFAAEASIAVPDECAESAGLAVSRTVSKAAGDRLRRGSNALVLSAFAGFVASSSVGRSLFNVGAVVFGSVVATLRDAALKRAGRSDDDCSDRLAASVVGGASEMRLATACAMAMLRSGG